ncbi:RagB/SusD family nutrient uptake outer membrane protein [Pedobacter sp. NJ-S-72]
MNKGYKTILAMALIVSFTACKKDLTLAPYAGITDETVVSTIEGLQSATIGTYIYIKDPYYVRNYHIFSEYASDNVSLSGTTTDPLFYAYNYQHQKNQGNVENFWRKAYQAVFGTNVVIEKVAESQDPVRNQLLGENYFF